MMVAPTAFSASGVSVVCHFWLERFAVEELALCEGVALLS